MKETFTYETQNNYSYKGFVDDTYRFIEDFQLMRPEISNGNSSAHTMSIYPCWISRNNSVPKR